LSSEYLRRFREPRIVVPFWFLKWAAAAFELLSIFGIKTDINRPRVRKLYQSTNMVPKQLQKIGFKYRYDLAAGLLAWSNRRQSAISIELLGLL
jgi:hypothetical protein